jgi:hypothetical protein
MKLAALVGLMAKLLLSLITNTPYTDCENMLSSLFLILQNPQGSTYQCFIEVIPTLRSVEIDLQQNGLRTIPLARNAYTAGISIRREGLIHEQNCDII